MSTICNQIVLSVLYHSDDIFWDLEHLFFLTAITNFITKNKHFHP